MIQLEKLSEEQLSLLELYIEVKKYYNQYEHMLNVSIRRAKNRDVFLNMLRNLVLFLEKGTDFILTYFKKKGVIVEIHPNYFFRVQQIKNLFPELEKLMEFYKILKKVLINVNNENYEILNEFRKNITLKTKVDNNIVEININKLKEFNMDINDFLRIMNNLLRDLKNLK